MPKFLKTLILAAGLAAATTAAHAATLRFSIETTIDRVPARLALLAAVGDQITVSGVFDTDDYRPRTDRAVNRDLTDVTVSGALFAGSTVTGRVLRLDDNDPATGGDIFRLVLDVATLPTAVAGIYDTMRLNFFLPVAADSWDTTFLRNQEDPLALQLETGDDGSTPRGTIAFRDGVLPTATNANIRLGIDGVTLAAVPVPASGLLLLAALGAVAALRRRSV